MVTGDYHHTAIAVARAVGMVPKQSPMLIIQAKSEQSNQSMSNHLSTAMQQAEPLMAPKADQALSSRTDLLMAPKPVQLSSPRSRCAKVAPEPFQASSPRTDSRAELLHHVAASSTRTDCRADFQHHMAGTNPRTYSRAELLRHVGFMEPPQVSGSFASVLRSDITVHGFSSDSSVDSREASNLSGDGCASCDGLVFNLDTSDHSETLSSVQAITSIAQVMHAALMVVLGFAFMFLSQLLALP